MRELELDGIHDDGEHVVLVDSDGEKYTLRITEALRAAVRRDRPALGALQAADAAPLRPREIQSLLRNGRSAEEIAEIAQVPVEHVRRYEGPVLAERAWTAQRARAFAIGRGGPSLDSVVAERLLARRAGEDTAWDSWRRPEGTWTLELTFSAAGRTRQAHWVVDLESRSVTALDDEARWITDEEPPTEPARGRGRLSAVRSTVYDVEADDQTAPRRTAPRTWSPARSAAAPTGVDEAELDALNARRGLRSVPSGDTGPVWTTLSEDVDSDDVGAAPQDADSDALTQHRDETVDAPLVDPEDSSSAEAPASDGESAVDDAPADAHAGTRDSHDGIEDDPTSPELAETIDLTPLPGFDRPGADDRGENDAADAPSAQRPGTREKPRGSKQRRSSIPSWDEIVFGSKHD